MKGSVLAVAAAAAVAVNSATFTDRAGDATRAPDVTQVAISNDDAGIITVRVTAPPGQAGAGVSQIGFGVDADENPDTGALYYGAEFLMLLFNLEPAFYRPLEDGEFARTQNPSSFGASYNGTVATFTFKASDVAMTPTSGFNIFAIAYAAGDVDTAPNIGTFNYQQLAGRAPAPLGADTRAPFAEAHPSSGVHGKRARLSYFVADGRGEAADTIRVYRGRTLLKTIRRALAGRNPFLSYSATWQVPKKVRGKLRFCVSSVDRAGNKSNLSCARLTIK